MSRYGILKSKKFKEHLNQRRYEREVEERLEEERIQEQTRQRQISEKIEKEKRKLQETFESLKSDWRSELSPQEEQVEIVEKLNIKVPEKLKSNWRKELNEGMTSSGTFFTTLPATGDTIIATQSPETLSGNSEPGFYGIGSNNLFAIPDHVDTMVFNVSAGVGQLELITIDNFAIYGPFGSGTHTVKLNSASKTFIWFVANGLATSGFGTWVIDNIRFLRQTPMNVFVSLDSPEATAFIRTDPMMSNLSPKERLQKLKEMLEASDEYVLKMLGFDFPGTGAVPPGEYDPFTQAPPGEAGDIPGLKITNYQSSKPSLYGKDLQGNPLKPGPQSPLPPTSRTNPTTRVKDFGARMDALRNPSTGYTEVPPQQGPQRISRDGNIPQQQQNIKSVQSQLRGAINSPLGKAVSSLASSRNPISLGIQGGQILSQIAKTLAQQNRTAQQVKLNQLVPSGNNPYGIGKPAKIQKNSYEPQGELISEKRKLKSPEEVLNKIPGYYDGKPAPLGFPVEPPPEMVNGMHPDLVDGKKVADRFNRLDPQSAQAMPLTGNPHIDKKVLKARKQPK